MTEEVVITDMEQWDRLTVENGRAKLQSLIEDDGEDEQDEEVVVEETE